MKTPIMLSHIALRGIRGVAALTLDLAPPAKGEEGQWTVLCGEGGCGKTTVLRAVALALRDLSTPALWPSRVFRVPYRSGTVGSIVVVGTAGRGEVTVRPGDGSETFTQASRPTPFPVFAYGARRGSALGGASRAVDLSDSQAIATLFDEGAGLVHAETWLCGLGAGAAREPARYSALFETILASLRTLLGLDEIRVERAGILVSGASIGTQVPLEALGDGCLIALGWFLDLIARSVDRAERDRLPLGPDFLQRMTGLCLVDGLDLHLHPRAQLDLIPRLRALLPRMSFLVTTHNPLTLVGARPEEIWVLSREDGAIAARRGEEAPLLLTGGQILGRYFGIVDLYPHELGEAVRRYGFLASDPQRSDDKDAELGILLGKMKTFGIEPGWEPVARGSKAPSEQVAPRAPRSRKVKP